MGYFKMQADICHIFPGIGDIYRYLMVGQLSQERVMPLLQHSLRGYCSAFPVLGHRKLVKHRHIF